jgi:lysophospholipase L1-like esterase
MTLLRRVPATLAAVPLAGAAFLLTQVLRAAHRSDLPSFPNQEPSGTFGDPDAPALRIVAVGDSSLTVPGVEDLDNMWIRRLAIDYADEHLVEFISLGVGGSKLQDVIEGQLEEALALAPDIAVVSAGANDAIRATPTARFRASLDHIVSRLEEAAGAVLVLGMGDAGSIPRLPKTVRPYLTRRTRIYDRICAEVVLAHPRAVKVYTRGRICSAFWEDRSLFAADQFHAGDRGHLLFAEEAGPAFRAAYAIARDGHGGPAGASGERSGH